MFLRYLRLLDTIIDKKVTPRVEKIMMSVIFSGLFSLSRFHKPRHGRGTHGSIRDIERILRSTEVRGDCRLL